MSSLVNLYEAPVATIQEKLKLNRVASVGIIAAAGCVVSLVIQGIVSGWIGRWSGGRPVNRRVEVQPRHLKRIFINFSKTIDLKLTSSCTISVTMYLYFMKKEVLLS